MVTILDFAVYFATIRLPIFGTHNVVNPHIKSRLMVADARSIAGRNITIGQSFGYDSMGIR
jgi:hypothetical protein